MKNTIKRSKYAHMFNINGTYYLISNISGFIAVISDRPKVEYLSNVREIHIDDFERSSPFSPQERTVLLDASIYTPSGVDEDRTFAMRIEEFRARKELNLILTLTEDCNFRCVYCYEEHRHTYMSTETIDKIISVAHNIINKHKIKYLRVAYFGGEPLLNKNVLLYAHKRFQNDFFGVKKDFLLITNGYLIDQAFVNELVCHGADIALQITIDGPPTIHNARRKTVSGEDSFPRIISNLSSIIDIIPVIIRVNMDRESAPYMEELLVSLKTAITDTTNIFLSFNATTINTDNNAEYRSQCLDEDVSMLKAIKSARNLAKEYGFKLDNKTVHYEQPEIYGEFPFGMPKFLFCSAYTGKHLVFMPNGDIFTCMERISDSTHSVGNLHGEKMFNQKYFDWTEFSLANYSKCRECPISCFCGGGCGSVNIANNKSKLKNSILGTPKCCIARSLISDNNLIF